MWFVVSLGFKILGIRVKAVKVSRFTSSPLRFVVGLAFRVQDLGFGFMVSLTPGGEGTRSAGAERGLGCIGVKVHGCEKPEATKHAV